MPLPDKKRFQLYLLRYMPDVVREEFVNVGAALFTESGDLTGLRFTHDWARVRCLFPGTDLEALQAFERDLQLKLLLPATFADFLTIFNNPINGLELSQPKAVEAIDAAEEMNLIARHYLDPLRLPLKQKPDGRNAILQTMNTELSRAGILKFMKQRVSVSQYTHPTDTFKIDYLYTAGDAVRMLQALPLSRSSESAINLAFRYPKICEGLRHHHHDVSLTVLVENSLARSEAHVAFALHILDEKRIRVAPLSEMPAIADAARIELRA